MYLFSALKLPTWALAMEGHSGGIPAFPWGLVKSPSALDVSVGTMKRLFHITIIFSLEISVTRTIGERLKTV